MSGLNVLSLSAAARRMGPPEKALTQLVGAGKIQTVPPTTGELWEIRCGPNNRFQPFYKVNPSDREVHVMITIGIKRGNRFMRIASAGLTRRGQDH